jgi:N-acetylglucosamine-6-phosphate deacetylase
MRLGVSEGFVDGRLVPGDVEVREGRITAAGLEPRGRGLATPGYVDLQVNGYAEFDLHTADEAGRVRLDAALAAAGTTAWRPTLITAPEDELIALLHGAWPGLGVHLEGPFLSPEKSGAHPPEHLRAPDLGLLRRLLDAGPVTQVTLAPELPGAQALVEELNARGVLVSAGHSAAHEAPFATVTHLHNAMAPELAEAALADPGVTVQLIVDGLHVPEEKVREAFARAPGRVALVSDCVGPSLGGTPIEAEGGAVKGAHGRLAGSKLTMAEAVRNAVAFGIPLETALAAATSVPARLAGTTPRGVVVLDDALEVQRVLR